jgi:hypothetical protein
VVLAHFVTNRKKHKKNQNQKQKFTFLYQRRHEKMHRYKNRHKKIFSLFYMIKYYQNQNVYHRQNLRKLVFFQNIQNTKANHRFNDEVEKILKIGNKLFFQNKILSQIKHRKNQQIKQNVKTNFFFLINQNVIHKYYYHIINKIINRNINQI